MTKRTKSNTPPKHVLTAMPRAGSSYSDSDYGQSVGPLARGSGAAVGPQERGPLGPASQPNIGPASQPNLPGGTTPDMAY